MFTCVWWYINLFRFVSSYLFLQTCVFRFASSDLFLQICVFIFASSDLRLQLCFSRFASSDLFLQLCLFIVLRVGACNARLMRFVRLVCWYWFLQIHVHVIFIYFFVHICLMIFVSSESFPPNCFFTFVPSYLSVWNHIHVASISFAEFRFTS